jgi:hypothetical protein
VDWNTLGNILTARMVEEVLYGSYIDIKHRESRPNFTVDTDWKFSYEESGVVVLRKNNADSPIHSWMGRTVIDFPLEEIASFIADPDSAPLYDKYITESRTVHRISHSETHTDAIGKSRLTKILSSVSVQHTTNLKLSIVWSRQFETSSCMFATSTLMENTSRLPCQWSTQHAHLFLE